MAATPSIRILKQTEYKGGLKIWGNRYHFSGGTPPDVAHWNTLADAIVAAEKVAITDSTTIVGAVYYGAGSDVPLGSKDYSTACTQPGGGTLAKSPLEVSALVRWSTDQRTAKNHPIYLFSYFRAAMRDTAIGAEELGHAQKAAFLTYANQWITGFSDGATTYHRAGPRGAVALGASVNEWVTHRDFPR